MADFERVSWTKYSEILNALTDLTRGSHVGSFRMRSLDEDEKKRDIINLLIKNSTIKGSIGDTSIYVIPIYFYVSSSGYSSGYGHAIIATLTITKDQSEYIIEVSYYYSSLPETSGREELEKLVDEEIGSLARLLKKTISSKNPNALKLVDIIGYGFCEKEIKTINLLEKIYGDEILSDDTIPGIHSVCFLKTYFFVNDKVIVIPEIDLYAVRDIHRNKIFRYNYGKNKYLEVSPEEEKIFYDALFRGYRDLLKPETVVKDRRGNKYSVSSTEVEVDGKRVSLVAVGGYDPEKKKLGVEGIIAIICTTEHGDSCSTYFFRHALFMHEAMDNVPVYIKETVLGYILGSEKTQKKAKNETAEYLIKKHTWEILPA